MASGTHARVAAKVTAQHKHLDAQIENLERKINETTNTIIDLKKQKSKIKERLQAMSLREERQSKKDMRYYKQLDLFTSYK
tara:strand:+ start:1933 stop:2175 length:243 start_codon:yes stop_codon:yes gene_type:complete